MFSTKAPTEKNERLSYLLDVYKLYHGHINTMFNYFLIISGLIGNACIQAMQKKTCETESLPIWIALFGALMSVVSLLIHLRSRDMLDTIEAGLKREEDKLFPNSDGFLNARAAARILVSKAQVSVPTDLLGVRFGVYRHGRLCGMALVVKLSAQLQVETHSSGPCCEFL